MTSKLKIDIVSDHVCPWCYIGKRRLEKALAQRPDIDAEITWLPFQLSPDMPREGKDRRDYMNSIFGEAKAATIIERMGETGREEGLAFQYKPGAKSANTLSAHVVMHWARQSDAVDQNELVEKLFAAYHVDCEDLGDPEVLARIAAEVGMDFESVLAKLQAGTDEEEVQEMMDQARAQGIGGVPFFILDRKFALSGAQPPESILEALDQITG